MSYVKTINEVDNSIHEDQILLPRSWRQTNQPMYINGDVTPSPGIYYTNLKSPEGSISSKFRYIKLYIYITSIDINFYILFILLTMHL